MLTNPMLTINELSLFLNPLDSSSSHAETPTPTTNTYRISSGDNSNDLSCSFDYDLITNEFTSQPPTSSTTLSITNVSNDQLYFSADFSSSTFNLHNNNSSDNIDIDVLESATSMAVQTTYEHNQNFLNTESEFFDLNSSCKSPSD